MIFQRHARVLVATALLCACSNGDVERPRSVILISIDTLRADHLGAYGYERPTSPSLDTFAKEGVLFERAMAPAPWTLPSHASLFTGLYPSSHGVLTGSNSLSKEIPTLAKILREEGFETAGFTNAIFFGHPYGLADGFDEWANLPESTTPEGVAPNITNMGLVWLDSRKSRRVFLFLHYFDVHSDYEAAPEYESLFASEPGKLDGTTAQLVLAGRGRIEIEAKDIEYVEALYDAGIRQLDEELGRLFRELSRRRWFDDSLVIVTSDHGEQFFEHGAPLHMVHYDEVLHVPLMMRGPTLPAGVRSAARVSLVDVAPTILGQLGLAEPAGIDGIDLQRFWEDPEAKGQDRVIFAEAGPSLERFGTGSVQTEHHKWILDLESESEELFDLRSDPEERVDLAADRPAIADEHRAAFEALRASAREPEPARGVVIDLEKRLRALGYVE